MGKRIQYKKRAFNNLNQMVNSFIHETQHNLITVYKKLLSSSKKAQVIFLSFINCATLGLFNLSADSEQFKQYAESQVA